MDNDRTSVFIVLHRDSSTGILITRDRVVPAKASLLSNIKAGPNSRDRHSKKYKSTPPMVPSEQQEFQTTMHYRSPLLSTGPGSSSSWAESTTSAIHEGGSPLLRSALNDSSGNGLLVFPSAVSPLPATTTTTLNGPHPHFLAGSPGSELAFTTTGGQRYYTNPNPSGPPWIMHTPGSAHGHGPVYFHHHRHHPGPSESKSGLPQSSSSFHHNTLGPSKLENYNGSHERFPGPPLIPSSDKPPLLLGDDVSPRREEPVIDPLLSGSGDWETSAPATLNTLSFGSGPTNTLN